MIDSAKYKALAMHDVFLKETNKTSCTLKHLNFIQRFKLKLIVLVLVTLNSDILASVIPRDSDVTMFVRSLWQDQTLLNYISTTLSQLKQKEDAKDLDAEAFYRLVLMTRAIAITRPQNLTKNFYDGPGKFQNLNLILSMSKYVQIFGPYITYNLYTI